MPLLPPGSLISLSPLFPNESLPSLLFRLSAVNRYLHSPYEVIHICQERLPKPDNLLRPLEAETFQVLSEVVRIDANELYRASIHCFAPIFAFFTKESRSVTLPSGQVAPILVDVRRVREHLYLDSDAQFCPLCLEESPYHRITWIPQVVTVCLTHQCLLIKGCPQCGKNISIKDVVAQKCPKCEFILTEAPISNIAGDEFGLLSQAIIQYWLGVASAPDQYSQSGLPDTPPQVLYRVLEGLHSSITGVNSWEYFYTSTASLNTHHPYLLYATAMKGLVNWPEGFYQFLTAYKQRDNHPTTRRIWQDLGGLYTRWLERWWVGAEFDFVQNAFDKYMLGNYDITPSSAKIRRVKDPALRDKFAHLTETEAAQTLGTTPDMVKRLLETGHLTRYKPEQTLPGPQFKLVERAGVTKLQEQWQAGIPLAEAVQLLGTSEAILCALLDRGLIAADERDRLRYQALDDFIARLWGRAARRRVNYETPPVELAMALQKFSEHGFSTASIFEYLLSGELRFWWPSAGETRLNRLEIFHEDMEVVIKNLSLTSPVLSGQQIANILRVKLSTVSQWVKKGLLVPISKSKRGKVLYFHRGRALEFINSFRL